MGELFWFWVSVTAITIASEGLFWFWVSVTAITIAIGIIISRAYRKGRDG